MLGKLFKYEIKATARVFIPLYAVLLLFSFINIMVASLSGDSFTASKAISMALYGLILIGTFVTTFIVMIQRFYKNLLKDEGYLMFTLPVKSWHHVFTKLMVSSMWTVFSVIVSLISILIIAANQVSITDIFRAFELGLNEMFRYFGISGLLVLLELIIATFIGLFSGTLMIYAAIAIGHLFQKHKILLSVAAYLILYTITQIIASVAGTAFFGLKLFIAAPSPEPYHIHALIWFAIGLSAIFMVAFYLTTNYILSKKLNLE